MHYCSGLTKLGIHYKNASIGDCSCSGVDGLGSQLKSAGRANFGIGNSFQPFARPGRSDLPAPAVIWGKDAEWHLVR